MEYYAALKRKEILTSATVWMKLKNIMLSGISPPSKQQILYDFTYMKLLRR
jgi:hypothetical protein